MGTSHRYHPDPNRNEEKMILYDDCPRCEEHAHGLMSLDRSNSLELLRRVADNDIAHSRNERIAMDKIDRVLGLLGTCGINETIVALTKLGYQM